MALAKDRLCSPKISSDIVCGGVRPRRGFGDTFPDGVADQPGQPMDVQLAHRVVTVLFDGARADLHDLRDILIAVAFGNQLRDCSGDQVVITLMNTGQTPLEASAGGFTRQLFVEVTLNQDNIMVVEISQ